MKKFLLLLAAAAVTLTACSGTSVISPEDLSIDNAYTFNADIQYGDGFRAAARFERKSASVWEITLTEPFALSGKILTYEQGNITASFEGLMSNNISSAVHSDAPYKRIIDAFENAVNGDGRQIAAFGEEITIASKAGMPANSYELVLDKRSLTPLRLTMPEAALTVTFPDVQVSQIVPVILPG